MVNFSQFYGNVLRIVEYLDNEEEEERNKTTIKRTDLKEKKINTSFNTL
jgi:hypothetical protein